MTNSETRVLLVDDDESLRRVTAFHLEQSGFATKAAASAEAAIEMMGEEAPHVLVTDVRMPGMDGLQLLRIVRSRWPEVGIVVITAHGSIESAVEAMSEGAHDYLVKPFEHRALRLAVEKAVRLTNLLRENQRLKELAYSRLHFDNLVATSDAMKSVLETAAQVAPRKTTVLILGESGTGKELMARAIHHASSRNEGPFVAVGTGALAEGVIDSELFGHRKGAFTGADGPRKGRFELASGGTIFLDEIGDLRRDLQVKLLRVLQENEVDPLGADAPVPVDVRVIAATNRDLEAMVTAGTFREDLFYRLSVLPLRLPPLRERKDDIPVLLRHFVTRFCEGQRGELPWFTDEALDAILAYDWPGNVRELENMTERAVVLNPTGPIGLADLPDRLTDRESSSDDILGPLPEGGLDLLALERELIRRALEKCGGNQSKTARYLGITRNTLVYRLEKHDIGPIG